MSAHTPRHETMSSLVETDQRSREIFRQMRVFKNQMIEFAIAGALAFVVFYLAIDRAVTALSLGL